MDTFKWLSTLKCSVLLRQDLKPIQIVFNNAAKLCIPSSSLGCRKFRAMPNMTWPLEIS